MDLREISDKPTLRHPWEQARYKLVRLLLQRWTPGPKNILDVGSGDAWVCRQLRRDIPQACVVGVDTAFTQALQEERLNLCTSLNQAHQLGLGERDTVLLLDVLEHVEDDLGCLREIAGDSWVKNGATFFITVPAMPSLYCDHDRFLGHYRRYSSTAFQTLISRSGLKILHCGHFFSLLLPPRWLEKLLNKPFSGVGAWPHGWFITTLISTLLWLDGLANLTLSRWGIRLPGLSLFAVCRKTA